MSPLQVLVSVQIIKRLNLNYGDCQLFYYCYVNNKVIQHYVDLNKRYFFNSEIYEINSHFPIYINEIKRKFHCKEFKKIFLANINGIVDQFVLSFSKFNELNTISEGDSSVNKYQSIFFKKKDKFFFKELIYFMLGKKYDRKKILLKRKKHYSIYKNDLANIEITKYLDSPFKIKKKLVKKKKKIIIFLGSVFQDFSLNDKNVFSNLVKKLELLIIQKMKNNKKTQIYFLPHPRSHIINFKNNKIKIANTNLIAEDFIIKKINSGYKVKIYCSIFSTVLINLKNLDYSVYYFQEFHSMFLNASKKEYPNIEHIRL